MVALGNTDPLDSVRLIGLMSEHIDDLLPEEFEIEVSDDDSEIVIELPSNDEIIGVLRFTNEREKGGCGGPEYNLRTIYAGNRGDEITTWFKVDEALQYLINQCEID